MDEIDNRNDKEKKPKEYYQINLDMGRIFWIVFLLGIVIIGIFVLGFLVGGGKEKSSTLTLGGKSKKGSGEVIVKKIFGEEETKNQSAGNSSEVNLQELFKQHPEGEMQVVSKNSVEEAIKQEAKKSIKYGETNKTQSNIQKQYTKRTKTTLITKKVYKPIGNYYIQVASFKKNENAQRLKRELEKNLYKVKIEKTTINGIVYYRVRVGPFASSKVAKNTMIAMKRRFKLSAPFIVKKSS